MLTVTPNFSPGLVKTRELIHKALLLTGVALAMTGCAATSAGSIGADTFTRESTTAQLNGPRAAAEAAQCFEEQGRFLPLSEFSSDSAAGRYTYRLRVSDLWFEQVRIVRDGKGSLAEWRLAPNLNAKWKAQFESDRLQPLRHCLGL